MFLSGCDCGVDLLVALMVVLIALLVLTYRSSVFVTGVVGVVDIILVVVRLISGFCVICVYEWTLHLS